MKRLIVFLFLVLLSQFAFAGIVLTPNLIDFGTVDRNNGASSSFKLKNTFASQTTFTVGHTGNFVVSSANQTLAANQEITISVNVEAGVSAGVLNGSVIITGGGESGTVTLKATVVDLFATTLSPSPLDIGDVELGQSKSAAISIHNTSSGPLTYSATANPSLFSAPGSINVNAGATGTMNVTFTPGNTTGATPGVLNVNAASGSSQQGVGSIDLKAKGVLPAGSLTTTPSLLDFGNVDRNAGAQLSFTLKNNSTISLSCTLSVTGNFVVSSSQSLTAGQQKTVSVNVEAGVSAGAKNGSITISALGGAATATVSLKANVVDQFATDINPLSLDFGTVTTASKSLNLTVKNTSAGALTYSGTPNPSLYSVSPASLNVAAGQSGTLTVVFTKGTATGSLPGTLAVKATSGGSTQTVGTVTMTANVAAPPAADLVPTIPTAPTITTTATTKKVAVAVKVDNKGTVNAGSFSVKVFFDGTLGNAGGISLVKAGQSLTITITFLAPLNTTGTHQVKAVADADNQIQETNETNNFVVRSVTF